MEHLRAIAIIPAVLVVGILDMVTRRFRPETTAQYLPRKYPELVVTHHWHDGNP